jgi:hypothetical protein
MQSSRCTHPMIPFKLTVALLALAVLTVPALPADGGPISFVDATASAGIDMVNLCGSPAGEKGWLAEGFGSGVAWLDYNNDGNLDLYVNTGSTFDRKPGTGDPNQLFRGDGKGQFTNVTKQAGVGDRGWGYGIAIGDIENDGDADIYISNNGPNVLYRNNADGTFTDITVKAGVGDARFSSSALFIDMEGDGDLDLYVGNYMLEGPGNVPRAGTPEAKEQICNYKAAQVFCGPMGQTALQDTFYRNNGDGTFTDVTRDAGVWLEKPRFTLGGTVVDYDNDGDADIYMANDSVPNSLWRNDGKGHFSDVGLQSLSALNGDGRAQAGMGIAMGDYDGDGWLDIITTNFSHDVNTLYRSLNGKFFMDDTAMAGLSGTYMNLSWGTGFYDFDLDGDQDLFIANGHVYPTVDLYEMGTTYRQANHLFVNTGGKFIESGAASGPAFGVIRSFRGAAFGDYDNDGDVDIFVSTLGEAPLLMRNDSPRKGHYLELRLIGTTSNRDAIGSRVIVTAGGRSQIRQQKGGGSYLSYQDPRLHFGLGQAEMVTTVEVVWPNGQKEVLRDVPADGLVTIRQGSGIVE